MLRSAFKFIRINQYIKVNPLMTAEIIAKCAVIAESGSIKWLLRPLKCS